MPAAASATTTPGESCRGCWLHASKRGDGHRSSGSVRSGPGSGPGGCGCCEVGCSCDACSCERGCGCSARCWARSCCCRACGRPSCRGGTTGACSAAFSRTAFALPSARGTPSADDALVEQADESTVDASCCCLVHDGGTRVGMTAARDRIVDGRARRRSAQCASGSSLDIELLALVGRLATRLVFIRCCKNGPLRSEHLSLFLSDGACEYALSRARAARIHR